MRLFVVHHHQQQREGTRLPLTYCLQTLCSLVSSLEHPISYISSSSFSKWESGSSEGLSMSMLPARKRHSWDLNPGVFYSSHTSQTLLHMRITGITWRSLKNTETWIPRPGILISLAWAATWASGLVKGDSNVQ